MQRALFWGQESTISWLFAFALRGKALEWWFHVSEQPNCNLVEFGFLHKIQKMRSKNVEMMFKRKAKNQ